MKFILLLVTLFSFIFSEECVCKHHENIWFRVSTEFKTIGQIQELDMSQGVAFADYNFVHLVVVDRKTGIEMVISFPYGNWRADNFKRMNQQYTNPKNLFRNINQVGGQ